MAELAARLLDLACFTYMAADYLRHFVPFNIKYNYTENSINFPAVDQPRTIPLQPAVYERSVAASIKLCEENKHS